MPLEINEMVVKIQVSDEKTGTETRFDIKKLKREIISECVSKVLRKITTKQER